MSSEIPPERFNRWLLLGLITCSNPSRRQELVEVYGSLERAAAAPESEWREFGLLRHSGANDIFRAVSRTEDGSEALRDLVDPASWIQRQKTEAGERKVHIICYEDDEYPAALRKSPHPPAVLYVRGDAAALARPSVAIVGARCASHYGVTAARKLSGEIALCGLVVVSGGARGVDSAAHRGALDAGGLTIAVMGCGLDRPYPGENASLFDEIAMSGAVVSEFPFGAPPEARHFPFRNRVIAGLSLGTIVVEGKETSGSMITADCALDAGRDVFAVPGPITSPLTAAPHKLLVQGARLVRGARDVIEELRLEPSNDAQLPFLEAPNPVEEGETESRTSVNGAGIDTAGLSAAQRRVLAELEIHRGRTADDLSAALSMPTGEMLAVMMDLELVGLAKQLPGGRFVRRKLMES